MKTRETTTPVRAFDRVYINGPVRHSPWNADRRLVNPTDNKVIGKVTMADESTPEKPSVQRKRPQLLFAKSKEYRWSSCIGCTTPWQAEWMHC